MSDAAAPAARRVSVPLLTLFVMLAVLMQSLDTTIANVALPYMQGALSASQDEVDWVLTSYIVAAAIMTPAAGWLAGRYGRTRVFVVSCGGFVVASALCGMSTSIGQIVAARLFQGVCGASLVPLAQAVLIDVFPPERRGRGMALFGIGVMVGPILGPTLGGWLTENYSWRWVFYINLPIGVIAIVGLLMFLPDTERRTTRLDWTGFLTLSLAVGAFQAMLDRGEQLDWFGSREIILEACAAGLGLYWFIVHSAFAKHPFIPPRLLRDRNFVVGVLCLFFTGMTMYSTLALLSPYLQNMMGYPVVTTGLTMAPSGVGTMLSMFLCGRLLNYIAARWLVLAGFAAMMASLWMMTRFSPDTTQLHIIAASFLQGFSIGLVFVSLSTVTFTTLAPELRAQGTGVYSLLRNMGSSIGISATVSLLQRNIQVNHAAIGALITPFNQMLRTGAAARLWNPAQAPGAAALDAVINQQAASIAYTDDFKLLMFAALCAMPLAFLIRLTPALRPDPEHAVVE